MQTRCHLSVLIHEQAKKYDKRRALIYRDFGDTKWKPATWRDFSRKVRHVSNAMLNIGVKVQENVGVFSQNCAEYLYTDFGAFGIRAVTVPFYATSSEQQIQYIIDDAQIRVLFVGEQEQYDKAQTWLEQAGQAAPDEPHVLYLEAQLLHERHTPGRGQGDHRGRPRGELPPSGASHRPGRGYGNREVAAGLFPL